MIEQREITFDEYPIGEPLGPIVVKITPDVVDRYRQALGTTHPLYSQPDPSGEQIAPYSIVERLALRLEREHFLITDAVNGTYQYEADVEFQRPPYLDSTVTLRGRTVGKEVKRGQFRTRFTFTAEDEGLVQIIRGTYVMVHLPEGVKPRIS